MPQDTIDHASSCSDEDDSNDDYDDKEEAGDKMDVDEVSQD